MSVVCDDSFRSVLGDGSVAGEVSVVSVVGEESVV